MYGYVSVYLRKRGSVWISKSQIIEGCPNELARWLGSLAGFLDIWWDWLIFN